MHSLLSVCGDADVKTTTTTKTTQKQNQLDCQSYNSLNTQTVTLVLHCNETLLFKNLLDGKNNVSFFLSRLLSVHAEISPLQASSGHKEKAPRVGKSKNKALGESKLIDEDALIIELEPVDGAVFKLVLSSYTRLHIPLNQLELGF